MKKLILPALLGLGALISLSAHAATQSGSFTVNLSFTPTCKVTNNGNATLTVTDAQGGANSGTPTSASLDVWCTNGVTYTLALDTVGTDFVSSSGTAYTYTDPTAKTTYKLTLSGAGATSSGSGVTTYTVAPTFISSTCTNSAGCSNAAIPRSLIVTY